VAPPKIEPQSFWAAWNAGEFGSIPEPPSSTPTPPFGPERNFGSGKFGTPCERMHRAIASAWDLILAVCDADGVPPLGR